MSSKDRKKKKDKSLPRKPRSTVHANMPKPKPIVLRGPKYYIEHALEYPILGCWVRKGWQDGGLTPVVVARQQNPERVIFGVFLVDYYCLGVKDALCNGDFPLKRFMDNLASLCSGEPEPCDADLAHELVYGSIEFARKYGFEPHSDYPLASNVLDPAEAHPPHHNLEFGQDGKPLFIAGPYDNANAIMAKLARTAGEGNFDYLVGIGGDDAFSALEDDSEEE